MTEQAQAVLATALRLTVEERAEVAAELLVSLDVEPDEDVEAWGIQSAASIGSIVDSLSPGAGTAPSGAEKPAFVGLTRAKTALMLASMKSGTETI